MEIKKKILEIIYKIISNIYILIFSNFLLRPFNNLVLSLALNAKGYKNYGSFYKTGEKKFIKMIKKDLKLSLDIGANTGTYTRMLLTETKSNVVAFEPMPLSFKNLKKIQSINKTRLQLFKVALGNKNRFSKIFFSDLSSEKATLVDNLEEISFIKKSHNKSIKINVKKLDNFFNYFKKQKIDFIKIDTEGYELEVLKGAKRIIKKHRPKYIQIEFNWHQLIQNQTIYNFSKILKNYDVFRILPYNSGLEKVNPARPENNIFHLSNFVFIRKDI